MKYLKIKNLGAELFKNSKFVKIAKDYNLLIDFDGVICDSIKENYELCSLNSKEFNIEMVSGHLFNEFRWMVRIPDEYLALLETLSKVSKEQIHCDHNNVYELFKQKVSINIENKRAKLFREMFFENRKKIKSKNFTRWLNLHKIYAEAIQILNYSWPSIHIVSSKDSESIRTILHHNNLLNKINFIWGSDLGDKIVYFQSLKIINSGEFIYIDDHLDNLETALSYQSFPILANWGYVCPDKNNNYMHGSNFL